MNRKQFLLLLGLAVLEDLEVLLREPMDELAVRVAHHHVHIDHARGHAERWRWRRRGRRPLRQQKRGREKRSGARMRRGKRLRAAQGLL